MGTMDPIFNPVITDGSEAFNKKALAAMTAANEKLALKPAFQRLEKSWITNQLRPVTARNSAT